MAFSFVGSLVKHAVKHFGDSVLGFGLVPVGSIATEVWEDWRKAKPDASPAELKAELQKAADPATFNREVEIHLELQPQTAAQAAKEGARLFLAQVPGKIQASMRRKDDPTGRTIPPDLPLRKAEDLLAFLPDRMPRFRPGDKAVLGTDLVVEKLLGVGGFGEVWKAIHKSRPHAPPVALKFCTDPAAAKTLRQEVELLDRVARQGRHKGIVELVYAHLEGEAPCLEYEFLDGGDLGGLCLEMHAANRATPDTVGRILHSLAVAVGFAHRLSPPIVHRDLKPANILTTRAEGRVVLKVADFGIGGIASDQTLKEWVANTQGGTLLAGSCTPLYASPQQRKGGKPDPRDDVYALGVIWFQLLTGDLAIEPPRGGSWKKKIKERGASAEMVELLERCIEDDPSDRPSDAQSLADELRPLLAPAAVAVAVPAAAPPPVPAAEEWFRAAGGKQSGPMSLEQLKAVARPDDLVWTPKLGEWKPAGSIPGLCPVRPPAPPPVPTGRATGNFVLNGSFQNGILWIELIVDGAKFGEFRLMTGCDLPFDLAAGDHHLQIKWGNTLTGFKSKDYRFPLGSGKHRITLPYSNGFLGSFPGFGDQLDIQKLPG